MTSRTVSPPSHDASLAAPTAPAVGRRVLVGTLLLGVALTGAGDAAAQSAPPANAPGAPAEVPPPPTLADDAIVDLETDAVGEPIPPTIDDRARAVEALENAEITIVIGDGERRLEYRVEGQLIFIEVIPDVGPRYFLIDSNGDGTMDARRDDLAPGFVPPRWRIFEW